jgi:gliding motility-associated-like protein
MALLSYAWTPAATLNNATIANPVATPVKNTVYTVQATDDNHCTYSDSINVHIRSIQFTASRDQAICPGSSIGLKATGGDRYQWQPAGSLNDAAIANPVATPDTTTEYSVYIGENTCGTDTTIDLRVVVHPEPVVTAQKTNDINCTSPNARLSAAGAISYVWFPATGLDNPNTYNPMAGADTTTTYFVKGTNQYGCSDTAAITVYVTTEGKVTFVVPNAFTPNGDGRNDCFGVKSWGSAVIEEFSVFTRWGEKVFTSNNPTQCWDGRYKGRLMEPGGYAYIIKAKTICGAIQRTGMVMLIR